MRRAYLWIPGEGQFCGTIQSPHVGQAYAGSCCRPQQGPCNKTDSCVAPVSLRSAQEAEVCTTALTLLDWCSAAPDTDCSIHTEDTAVVQDM